MFPRATELCLSLCDRRRWGDGTSHSQRGVSAMIRNCPRALSLLLVLLVPVLLLVPGSSRADDDETVRFLTSIPVPGTATNTTGGNMYVYDISWVDPTTQRYYLADRSNAVVDVVDAKRGVFVKQISGGFKGFTGSNDTSGPNGVLVAFPWLFVTDAQIGRAS